MENKFPALVERLARSVQDDYDEAHGHATKGDSQRAGHGGEATWARLLVEWGPGWPVVTRKYVVGPGGSSNEVDVIVLKPDYPSHLHREPEILASGVAAAFSSKLTLRKKDISEAILQKKRLIEVAAITPRTAVEALRGPFPYGLLAHSTGLHKLSHDFRAAVQESYEQAAHSSTNALISHPREELDALLVADAAFFSGSRISLVPVHTVSDVNDASTWLPVSVFNKHDDDGTTSGVPLVQFVTWVASVLATGERHALESLQPMFGASGSSGRIHPWPLTVYPEHLRDDRRRLFTSSGSPIMV